MMHWTVWLATDRKTLSLWLMSVRSYPVKMSMLGQHSWRTTGILTFLNPCCSLWRGSPEGLGQSSRHQ
eukprot:6413893-Amphidinium_carterae.1